MFSRKRDCKSLEVVAIVSVMTYWKGKELASWNNLQNGEVGVLLKGTNVDTLPYNSANGQAYLV